MVDWQYFPSQAELQEVVGDEEAEDAPAVAASPASSPSLDLSPTETPESPASQQVRRQAPFCLLTEY